MDQNHIAALADWVVSHWDDGFKHSYSIASSHHVAWKKWRDQIQPQSPNVWWCDSLKQAALHYSWTENGQTFESLSMTLKKTISVNDTYSCADTCNRIFEWGGVARKKTDNSRQWIYKNQENGQLCSKLKRAISLLRPDGLKTLIEFDGKDLLMNSAMTKVYAAADEQNQIVMYDGRVGAALGLIVRRMLEEREETLIPDGLNFRWGAPASNKARGLQTRDPSSRKLTFLQLPNTSNKNDADLTRAILSKTTNLLCKIIVDKLKSKGQIVKSSDIERALFMIGYDVRSSEQNRGLNT